MGNKMYAEKINTSDGEQMTITGYKPSCVKLILTWMAVVFSGGLLLLLLSWRRSIMMSLTHVQCTLEEAEKVLLIDSYKQEFVERVIRPKDKAIIPKQQVHFYNKKTKYIWDPQHSNFVVVGGLEVNSCSHFYAVSRGLTASEANFRLQYYGKNSIFVEVKPVIKLILREVRSPFYIYQMFIVVVWLIQLYYQFALCIVFLSIISITATVWETRKQSKALRDAVRTHAIVTVLRDGKEVQKSSDELVPGDVIVLPQSQFTMVCDAVLLCGTCVVNESMLTGESTPITKVPVSDDASAQYQAETHKRNTLFCGTQILHSRSLEDSRVKAIVYRTGFSTAKGELVRAILFPKPVNFKLYSDLFKSMIVFFVLGIPPMVYTGITWVNLGAYVKDIVIIVVDVITFLVPPVLPAVLTSINAHAQRRLRKHGIYCLNSRYVNFCGGLDVVCFDKTGTLTEDSLDLSGIVPVENGRFQPALKDLTHLPKSPLLMAMAACHSLTKVDDKLLGHTLDLKMFEAIGWELVEPTHGDKVNFERLPPRIVFPKTSGMHSDHVSTVAVVRQFPFESLLRRMSVVTKVEGSDHFDVYLKGAPELVSSFSCPETVPEDFKQILEFYTRQGFRVLAVGWKALPPDLSWDDALNCSREDLECDLCFQGLLVLQNRLKPETVPTLRILNDADIRTVMVTGDNLLTALTVARDCGMIEEHDSVVSAQSEMVQNSSVKSPHLEVQYAYVKLPGFSEKLSISQNGVIDDVCIPSVSESKYHIAVEGSSFNLIRLHNPQLLNKVVQKGTIFARMLPEQKLWLIETLQNLGHQVGMCGDGANDCGALKTANAGVSLSLAEASVASPFTSTQQNIQCIPSLIREGRATLTATFGAFRYMVCYCFVLLTAVLMLFWDGQKPSDGGYVLIDIVLNLIPPILFGSTHAYPGLVKRQPTRSIISFIPQFSMFTFILIQMGVYALAYEYCLMQPWYEPFVYNKERTHTPPASYTGTAILSVNMMSYVIAAVIFAPGPPYRKNFLSNKLYLSVVLAEFLLVSYLTIYPAEVFSKFINLKPAPFLEYHLVLYLISLANFILCYAWEVFFIQGILFHYMVPALRKLRGPIHKYEKLERELQINNDWPPVGKVERKVDKGKMEKSEDDVDACIMRHSSPGFRNQLNQRSSGMRQSLLSGFKLSRFSDCRSGHREPMSFVTFKDGRHELQSGHRDCAQEFV